MSYWMGVDTDRRPCIWWVRLDKIRVSGGAVV